MELIDKKSINYVEDYLHLGLPRQVETMLIIEVDGLPEAVEAESDIISRVCWQTGSMDFTIAHDAMEADRIWQARRAVSPAIARASHAKIGEDICVPRSAIPAMVRQIIKIEKRFGLPIVIFGHAGDGNLHPNILFNPYDSKQVESAESAVGAIFDAAIKLGGTLSGEHGIGLTKKPFLYFGLSPPAISLMRAVKKAIDPANKFLWRNRK